MKYIVPFSTESVNFMRVGGKGINLIKLAKKFNIPGGFVIATNAYTRFVEANNLEEFIEKQLALLDDTFDNLSLISQQIRDKFHKFSLPTDIQKEILASFHSMEKGAYAVRSSATAEDLPTLSFAGQHDTFLNIISDEDLEVSVVQCFSSMWTARAIQYRKLNNIDQLSVTIAVVVQRMVESEISGVMFTANPITGNRKETVIEAIMGLGEALVSGLVEPDTYIVNEANELVSVKIGKQQKAIFSIEGGGTVERDVAFDDQILSEQQIIELREMGKQIFTYYNTPQDIEWAIQNNTLYILQSRGITTLYPFPENVRQDKPRILLSFNALQGVMDPFTPYGLQSLFRFAYGVGETFHFANDFEHQQTLLNSADRMWTDVTDIYMNTIGRKVLISFIGIADPESQKIFRQLAKEERFSIQKGRPRVSTFRTLFRGVLFFGHKIREILRNPDLERELAYRRSMQFLALHEQRLQKAPNLTAKLVTIDKTLRSISNFIFTQLAPFIAVGMMSLVIIGKISEAEKYGITTFDLTRSTPYNPTTIMNLNIWERAVRIRENSTAKIVFEQKSVEELTELYKTKQLPPVAQTELTEFLHEYGFRGFAEIDIGRPKWNELPEEIISHFKSYVQFNNPEHYPDVVFKKGKTKVQAIYHTLFEHTVNSKFGNVKANILNFMYTRNRKVFGYREFPKFIWVKGLSSIRNALLSIAADLVAQNVLDSPDDIFFLHHEDLKAFAKDSSTNLRVIASKNRITYNEELSRTKHPRVLLNTGETYYHPQIAVEIKEGNLLGSPVSSGVVKGKARIMMLPNEGTLQTNEILVCPATDPSWTPLFQIASGLVMEIGGMMTHGGVVAREHGIPAVVSVADATTIIKTGQLIRVNGNTGLVEILSE